MKQIIVDVNSHQTRVALLDEGVLQELYIERVGRERLVGNIYKGRVQNVLPGMQAAFVDIGLEKNAFLYAGDIMVDKCDFEFPNQANNSPELVANIRDIVKSGQEIMLQVLKDTYGTKGVRATTHITLPGRTIVLMPTVNYIGVSRRIENEEERSRLKEIMERIKPDNMGVIVRTAACGESEEEFKSDLEFLIRIWEKVQQKAKMLSAPRLIHCEETLIFRTIRDMFTADIDQLIVNEVAAFEKVQIVAGIISPQFSDRVKLFDKPDNLFDYFELENKLLKLLCRKVWLKNGSYLVIDQTEALTVIDVNTGKFVGNDDDFQETIFNTNIEAAKEIARQLRLRDIGGIIIIDFIDMEVQQNKNELLDILRNELKKDRTKSNVVGMTGLGLVELTRKKMRKCLSATIQTACPYCKGESRVLSDESMAHRVRRQLVREFNHTSTKALLIEVSTSVASFIESRSGVDHFLPQKPNTSVYVKSVAAMHVEDYNIVHITDNKMLEKISTDSKVFIQ